MSSIVNRSGGGLKLLDSFAVSSSGDGTDKPLTYFDGLKVQDYDLIFVEGLTSTLKSGHIATPAMLSGFASFSGSFSSLDMSDGAYLHIKVQGNSNKIFFYIGQSSTHYAGTINIYGIQL